VNGRRVSNVLPSRAMRAGCRAAVLCAAIGLAGAPFAAEPLPRATPESVGLKPAKLQEATELLNRFVADRKIAGAVAAVARRGKLVYLQAAGMQDLESRAPMTDRSLFRIYSMTKPVTAVAAMMLHERGRFALNDPVAKYIPEFANLVVASPDGATRSPARAITIQDLLLHTSGLNHRTSAIYQREKVRSRAQTLPQFVANIVRVPLMEDPGTRYRYSESPTVVGRLIEIWSGQAFDRFLASRIFEPLGMTDTTFWVSPEQTPRFATRYALANGALTPNEIEDVPFTVRPALLEGAVGLVSTAPDFLRFSQMLLNKGELAGVRLLSAKTVEAMTINGLSDAMVNERNGMGWGVGNVDVVVDPARQKTPASRGEYTWNGSAGTYFWNDPAADTVTILMTQYADRLPGQFKAIVRDAVAP
jgi:CubicO group peptidase (beta-lactamase class C family)